MIGLSHDILVNLIVPDNSVTISYICIYKLNTLQELGQSSISSKTKRERLFGTALNPVECGHGILIGGGKVVNLVKSIIAT
jgi:hypothetical protein